MLRFRKLSVVLAWAFGIVCSYPLPSAAQDYPSRPVRVLVGYAAGGVVDSIARLYAEELSRRLGQPFVIDNLPGAFMQRPSEAVMRAPPDGYTLMVGTDEMVMWPYLKSDYKFRLPGDFSPIAPMAKTWTVFAIKAGLSAKSFPDFIEYAKQNPGMIRYGSSGTGGVLHVAVELLKLKTGLDLVHVPYRSGAQSVTDLLAGQIEMNSMGLASARALDPARAHAIAQTGPRRHPMLAEVPTTAELGLPDIRIEPWFFLVGPANMPASIVNKLNAELAAIAGTESFRHKLEQIGFVADSANPKEFVARLQSESDRWKQLIPAMGLKITN